MVLRIVTNGEVPENVDLNICDITVQVSGLPFSFIHAKMAEFLGNTIGRFVEYDDELHQRNTRSVMSIQVAININKPLLRVLNIEGPNNRSIQLTLGYERLPNFCYYCGLLGHLVKDCASCLDLCGANGRMDESKLPYGDWLRVRPPNHNSNYIGGVSSRPPHQFVSR